MRRSQTTIFFPLLLLSLFTCCALFVFAFGARSLDSIKKTASQQEEFTISLAYIKNKIERSDAVSVETLGTQNCLHLQEQHQDTLYDTYIYPYENTLRELYIQNGLPAEPADGTVIAHGMTLEIDKQSSLITLRVRQEDLIKEMKVTIAER